MIAIQATYYGPTNTIGSRFKLKARDHKAKFYPFEYNAPGHDGITLDTARQYARECFPHADLSDMRGPYFLKADTYVFTLD